MTNKYTPTTAEVRAWYGADEFGYPAPEGQEVPGFDRWLAGVQADAWDACLDDIEKYEINTQQAREGNPYRKEQN
jgi:hypothetical protein